VVLASILAAGLAWSTIAKADNDEHVRGVISAHGDDGTVTVRSDNGAEVVVAVRDFTRVVQRDGARERRVSLSALVPGLRIDARGSYQGPHQFSAERVTFKRTDAKMAQAIYGGVDPTDRRSLENQRRIEENTRTIERQEQTLARQTQQIAANNEQIQANDAKMVATTGALATRITNLDDYKVITSTTVYFPNGSAAIAQKYRAQIGDLAAKAKGVNGYAIQIQGYASAVGSNALNQRLSKQRADAVTAILQQHGVELTNIVVPAAMGTTGQVASNKTARGQAENRRTVLTLLQNKGISER
jgi:outer membrane protein OmpA-like peptidoglycan-associated protein